MFLRILIIITILLVGVAAFSHLNSSAEKSTDPLLNGLGLVRSWFSSGPSPESTTGDDGGTVVYKWQDENGAWQFSNQPPPEGIASSVKIYRGDTNVTKSVKAAKAESPASQTAMPSGEVEPGGPLMPITDPDRVKQLIEDARNVQNLVDQRQQSVNQ